MTIDKFGRHLLKHINLTSDNDETRDISEYMYYNLILTFDSDKIEGNKFILKTGKTCYTFPLEGSVIKSVNINVDTVSFLINNKVLSSEEIPNFLLNKNDTISFLRNENLKKEIKHLFAEIIIKCPIHFEKSLVISEKAYYKHSL